LIAARQLKQNGLNFEMRIVGDGPLRQELEQQAESLGVSDRVRFIRHIDDVPLLLTASSFLVHTSDNEGCPNAVMEAMACGRAVVATRVGDIPHLVEDGRTGFVVPKDNPSMLAERMAQLTRNPDACRHMGRAASEKARRDFGLERLVRETLTAYRRGGWTECTPHVSSVHGSGT
jgi:glycosyltransferase involved in cell wall biosynthesis